MRTQPPCIIAGKTAIRYWLGNDCQVNPLPSSTANKLLQKAQAPLRGADLSGSQFGEPPYEILVADDSRRRNKSGVRCLPFSRDLPPNALVRQSSSIAICAPAFAFCQVCRKLTLAQRVELGTNLCASFWLDWLGDIQTREQPLTSVAQLSSFCQTNTSLYGSAHARRALQWVKDGSASPMETKLMIILSLPPRFGGFGFRNAQFNYQVNPGIARGRIEQGYFRIDIAFPEAKVGIEFDSTAFHQDFSKDRRRVNGLESLGWRIVSVDKQQLYSTSAMRRTARQIAKLLGVRMSIRSDWDWLHAELRRDLSL